MNNEGDLRETQPSAPGRSRDGSWMACTAGGLVGIWTAVLLISLLSPDMVSGSQQERLPVVALSSWVWGLGATGVFFGAMGRLRGRASEPIWVGLTAATLVIWLVATILSLTLPVFVTGSDPTRIPIGSLVTPIAATVLTTFAGIVATFVATPGNEWHPASPLPRR